MSEASCRLGANGRCDEEEGSTSEDCCLCLRCPPQLFTAILLGILACVLVTGGVFLAFHKWDHAWLLVSAVGIILMAIGTALHCCSSPPRKGHSCKGGCGGRAPPDVGGPGGPLTEQLLPLSNARSVSQLSLNMVPGYFPPVVFPGGPHGGYGLEQHSAAVQNISRLVQHQQQLHLQPSNEGGKGFLLLSLPAGDANQASIQNLVAAVYQLDNSVSTENGRDPPATDVSSQTTEASFVSRADNASTTTSQAPLEQPTSSSTSQPVRKNAEVQTYDEWPVLPGRTSAGPEIQTPSVSASQTISPAVETEILRTEETVQCSANTVEVPSQLQEPRDSDANNLVCDSAEAPTNSDIPSSIEVNGVVTAEEDITLIVSEPATSVASNSPEEHAQTESPEVGNHSNVEVLLPDHSLGNNEDVANAQNGRDTSCRTATDPNPELEVLPSTSQTQQIPVAVDFDVSSSIEDLSDSEDSELLERSSPPPSYEDVTQEAPISPVGAFGLAYGTI